MCLKAGFTSDRANSILLILEKDDDKYKSIGYGKYKLKTDIGPDGKGKEGTPTFTKDDAGNYVKSGEDDEKKDDEKKKKNQIQIQILLKMVKNQNQDNQLSMVIT